MANAEPRSVVLIRTVCELAGSISFLYDIDAEIRRLHLDEAVATSNTAPIFDWLLATFSFQGISDRVAHGYIEKHGSAEWSDIAASLTSSPSCSKLRSYWHYAECGYQKSSLICSQPNYIGACPVPRLKLRNGRLNQTAYSLYLFIRDIADGDIVRWIDGQFDAAMATIPDDLQAAQQEAIVGPLRNIFGVSDKVLTMALSSLMMGVRGQRPGWFETGKVMMTIDTLVHNFMHRTGILDQYGVSHGYGPACYAEGGCAEIIRSVSARIDARLFNPTFPSNFPRFVQHAIWRFCAADGLNICNGNQIDDREGCRNAYCQLGLICARNPLKGLRG